MKIVLFCSVWFYAAVTEFVFGAVKWEVAEGEPNVGDMYYNM
jgi:hypothetical protein